MFLNLPESLCQRTEFRLAVWYAAVFIIWSVILFVIISFLIFSSIRLKERRILQNKAKEYVELAREKGLAHLLDNLEREKEVTRDFGLFVLVVDSSGAFQFASMPKEWRMYTPQTILNGGTLETSDRLVFRGTGWIGGEDKPDRSDSLEIIKKSFSDGGTLYLGQSSEEIEDILLRFFEIFFILIIPLFVVAISGGVFLSLRTLKPLKELVHAVYRVETGEMNARVPCRNTKDELDKLATMFNRMLEKIELLVQGMREALDNVAHDLKTPMTRMRASIEKTIQAEIDLETLMETLMDCAEESERVVDMLNALMDISEAETGTMNLNMKTISLFGLIGNICDLYFYSSENKHIKLTMSIPETLTVWADSSRLYQVIANLVDNAVKYTPENGWVHIHAVQMDAAVRIVVEDTGPGIPSEDIPRIFERLYRGDKSRSQRGLGLGLALVKAVVNAHDGEITAVNLPGGGARFTLIIPMAPELVRGQ